MKEGTRVSLRLFDGRMIAPADVSPNEDYWKLIGSTGLVVRDPSEPSLHASFSPLPRLLIKFETDVASLGLECHNKVANSLWILETDLEVLN